MTSLSEQFLAEVERFLLLAEMDATAFGLKALNDGNFVFSLRKGRSPSARTIDRVREFMAKWSKESPSKRDQTQGVAAE